MADANSKQPIAGQDENFQQKRPPTAAYISWFTAEADVASPSSIFHRLGFTAADAAAGNHKHDGRDSAFLFNPATDVISGDLSNLAGQQQAIRSIARMLATLGAKNSTIN